MNVTNIHPKTHTIVGLELYANALRMANFKSTASAGSYELVALINAALMYNRQQTLDSAYGRSKFDFGFVVVVYVSASRK